MTAADSAKVLSIGSVLGGRTAANRPWSEQISSLTREVATRRSGVSSPVNVNVVFHIAGNLIQPEFTGVRTGSFRKSDQLLMVQVALPEDAPPDPRSELLAYLDRAIDEVQAWAARRRLDFDPQPLRGVIDAVRRA